VLTLYQAIVTSTGIGAIQRHTTKD